MSFSLRLALFSLSILMIALSLTVTHVSLAQAQVTPDSIILASPELETLESTDSGTATDSGAIATPSAEITQKIQEKKDKDLTETNPNQKSKLVIFLEAHPIGELSWHNFIQYGIRQSVA